MTPRRAHIQRDAQVEDVRVCGQRIHTCVLPGAGEDTPLLICNGLGVGFEMLYPLVDALGERTIILFDAPGSGRSSTPLFPYPILGMAALLDRLLSHLKYGEVDVMGISWGGAVAQEFALDFAKRCRRLVLAASTTGAFSIPGNPISMALLANPRSVFGRGNLWRNAGRVYGGDFRDQDAGTHASIPLSKAPNPLGYLWQMMAIGAWTSVHRLARLRAPTLLLAGEDDPLVPLGNARLMHSLIPDSELATFDCGHMFPLTRAEPVAKRMREFLA